MKKRPKDKFPYTPFETFCLRTPFLSLEYFSGLTEIDEITDDFLLEQLKSPEISEAIYLASPELHGQLIKWSQDGLTDDKKIKRLRSAVLKYLTRMSTRCTPFGLFATIGTGNLAEETKIEETPKAKFQKRSHYDMNFLVELAIYLANLPHIKKQLNFSPNSSIYKIGNRYRYVEYTYEKKQRVYALESIAHSTYLEYILEEAKSGLTIIAVVDLLEKMDIDKAEAEDFVNELINNQILVSELEPSITGPDFLKDISTRISGLKNVDKELALIKSLQDHIAELDQHIGNSAEDYRRLIQMISKLKIAFEPKYLLQTDTFAQYKVNTLNFSTIRKIKQAIAFFNKISDDTSGESLQEFKRKFVQRFEHQKMPLLKVLDVETGIGYGQSPTNLNATPYLDDIVYHGREEVQYGSTLNSPLQAVLHKKLTKALVNKKQFIELHDEDFPDNDYDWKNAADTISVMTEVILEKGQEKVVVSSAIEHAARLLGRFGHGDKALQKLLVEIAEKESEINPEHLLAEIIHLPEARTGNILRRPDIRDYEIPYLGKSNVPLEKQIQLEDLLVSVEEGLVVLHSKKFDKPIYPRLSNAHNVTENALPVYQFLCKLQYQKQQAYGFLWPSSFYTLPFLPQVIYNDCILSRAKWNVESKDIKVFIGQLENKKPLLTEISKWRKSKNIPEVVQLADSDNTLPINLSNYNSVRMFLETVKNRNYFTLEEFYGLQKQLPNVSKKTFNKQYVLSFYNHLKSNRSDD